MPKKKNAKRKASTSRMKQINPSQKPEMLFEVKEDETLDQCLERIEEEGYRPVRRMEEPIFKEVTENGETKYQPVSRKVIFEATKNTNNN